MARESQMRGALSKSEFNSAVKTFPRLSEKAISAGRMVLVDAHTFQKAADALGVSRQMVHAWCSKIYSVCCPPGWETAVVRLPSEQMRIVKQMELEARAQLKSPAGETP